MRRAGWWVTGLTVSVAAWAADGAALLAAPPAAPWHVVGLLAQRKPYTVFDAVELDGARVLRVTADKSYGNLVHPLPPGTPAGRLQWRWRVDEPNPRADLRERSGDDNALEVCALFDLPLDKVPFLERQLLRALRLKSAEIVPSASVCYVWDEHFPAGTTMDNAFTRRLRIIVLRGTGSAPKAWTSESRDLEADFRQLFGDESGGVVPPLAAIAVGADADNTQSHTVGYVDDLQLIP